MQGMDLHHSMKLTFLRNILRIVLSYPALMWFLVLCVVVSIWVWMREGGLLLPRIPFYLIGFAIAYAIGVIAYKYQPHSQVTATPQQGEATRTERLDQIKLLGIGVACYAGLALLLYCAWLKGDDYAFIHDCGIGGRIEMWWQSYLKWVSRSGELVAHLLGISQNRWQVFILVPLLVVFAPALFFRMVSSKKQRLSSGKGRVFYVLCLSILILSTQMESWRIFYCFAASMNYLFPSLLAVLFLSFYNPRRWFLTDPYVSRKDIGRSLVLFILGIYVCWGGESLSLIVLTLLIAWFLYRMLNRLPIPPFCWLGSIGAVLGATALFAAPALKSRTIMDAQARALDISGMSQEQINLFIDNLNWEQVNLLKGGSSVIVLEGIPLWQHVHFLPYLLERYVTCSAYVMAALLICTLLCFINKQASRTAISVICGTLCVSLFGACAYLYSCIPTPMSFAPATLSLIGAIAYLYWNCNIPQIQLKVLSFLMLAIALYHTVPAGIEAWEYKPYEAARFKEITRQKEQGNQSIVLPAAYPETPEDSLGLIRRSDLKDRPDAYPNEMAAGVLNVKSIIQQPCK